MQTHLCPPKIWTHVHPLQNTCCVTLSTLDWVFSWLNTWNWNYPNKLFWQLLKVFWSKPECLYSQCFHTESVPVTVILCLFFVLECRFLPPLHQLCKDKNKGTKATFWVFKDLLGESLWSNSSCNLFITESGCYFVAVISDVYPLKRGKYLLASVNQWSFLILSDALISLVFRAIIGRKPCGKF